MKPSISLLTTHLDGESYSMRKVLISIPKLIDITNYPSVRAWCDG